MCRLYRRRFARLPLNRWALGSGEWGKRDPANPQFTDHQFTGDYPTGLTDLTGRGKSAPKTLSLMKEGELRAGTGS